MLGFLRQPNLRYKIILVIIRTIKTSMSPTNPNNFNFLSRIAALVGLISASLYFTGWIYRWSYFGFFHLEVTTLDLAFESFLIVPLQVFFVNNQPRLLAVLLLLLFPLAAWLTIFIFQGLNLWLVQWQKRWRIRLIRYCQKAENSRLRWLQPWAKLWGLNLRQWSPQPVDFSQTLVDELIKVALVLVTLFWLARNQGLADAQRDAFNQTSTLPVVTLIVPENMLSFGRQFDPPEALADKQAANKFRMIGDRGLIEAVRGASELNDLKNQKVWRLLIERDGWIYLFRTLKPCSDSQLICAANKNERPLVLMVRESQLGNQLLILSPSTSE